jgi:REP element-mobilizing transposase RayT
MARPLRPEVENGFWHVWNRGNEQRDIVRSDSDREMFLELLAETVRRYRWRLHDFILLTNHFHLSVEASTSELSTGMHWLQGCYASWFNRTHGRSGHLFQGRFKSSLVEDETYLRELGRYIVLNAVRAGMVEHPADYPWSSYRSHAGLDPTPEWLDNRFVLERARDPGEARARYRAFVEETIDCRQPLWDRLIGQIYFGSRQWVETMQFEVIDMRPRSDEHSTIQRCAGKPPMATIVEVVAGAAGVAPDVIRDGRGGATRMLVAWLGWYEGIKQLRQIAASLRLRSTGHVSNLVRRCDSELRDDPILQRIASDALAVLRPPPLGAGF